VKRAARALSSRLAAAQNEFGNTVAHWACWRKSLPILKVAQAAGGELNIQNNGVRGRACCCARTFSHLNTPPS
jgi:hypothetical protein